MKVDFTHKGGRIEAMEERYAKILQGLKRGTYQTRDMAPLVRTKPLTAENASSLLGENVSDLDLLDQAGLHALASELGIKLHPQTGAVKARKAIEDFRAGKK